MLMDLISPLYSLVTIFYSRALSPNWEEEECGWNRTCMTSISSSSALTRLASATSPAMRSLHTASTCTRRWITHKNDESAPHNINHGTNVWYLHTFCKSALLTALPLNDAWNWASTCTLDQLSWMWWTCLSARPQCASFAKIKRQIFARTESQNWSNLNQMRDRL